MKTGCEKKPIDSDNEDEIVYPSRGVVLSLDRTMPPESVSSHKIYNIKTHSIDTVWKDFIPSEHVIRFENARHIDYQKDCHPYALTFTFNAEFMRNKSPLEQWEIFEKKFNEWKALFLRRSVALQNHRQFIAFEVYPELTKQNIVHCHGLFYYNSGYENIRTIMSKAWVDKTRKDCGTSLSAMKKKTPKGYDYAFDKCHNVTSWRKYITKEHPEYVEKPCLTILPPLETYYDVSMSYQHERMEKLN